MKLKEFVPLGEGGVGTSLIPPQIRQWLWQNPIEHVELWSTGTSDTLQRRTINSDWSENTFKWLSLKKKSSVRINCPKLELIERPEK